MGCSDDCRGGNGCDARFMKSNIAYADDYRNVDFRKYPKKYKIGRGEQGVLIAEPYKSEILPYWKFRTPAIAEASARKIYEMFEHYKSENDFCRHGYGTQISANGFHPLAPLCQPR